VRVLHVTNYYPGLHEHAGGAEQAIQWTLRLHAEAGFDNLLLTTPAQTAADVGCPRFEARTLESRWPRLKQSLEPAKWYALQLDPLAAPRILELALRQRVDAVHLGNAQFVTLGLLPLLRRAGIKVVLSIYDYWLFCPLTTLIRKEREICRQAHGPGCLGCLPREHRWAQWLLLGARPAVMQALVRAVDRFVVLSDSSRRIAESRGVRPDHLRVIRLPRERQPRGDPATGQDLEVLLVGWQQWRKGIHVALEAWPLVLRRHPGARLHVVGGGVKFGEAYKERLEQQLDRHRLRDSVVLHGRVSDEELDRRLERAAVVLIPEQWENMSPLILLRCMERGKAVVASRIGGIPEFVRHDQQGLLARATDPADFADGAARLLSDPGLRERLGRAAMERVEQLCAPDRARQAWVELYRELGL
jgi:glycosyltransferase involved in cell wall biosynthesis